MKSKLMNQVGLVAGMLAATSFVGGAATVNVDLGPNGAGTYVGVGAAPDAGTVWNNVSFANAGVSITVPTAVASGLVDSTGAASSVGFRLESISPSTANTQFRSFGDGGTTNLQGDRLFSRAGALGTVVISGLDDGKTYDLYLYTGGSFGTDFTIGAVTQYADASSDNTGGFVEGEDYVLFSGISSVSNEVSIGIQDGDGALDSFGVLSGFQVVEVPEPSSAALLGAGVLMLTLRRRRDA